MTRDQLRNLAVGRRNPSNVISEASERKILTWTCHHCDHPFVSERVYMKHRCKEMLRNEELRSPLGQAAFSFYKEWMRLSNRRAPPIETFGSSRYYASFIKFANHVKRVHLPTPLTFVRSMVDNKLDPSLWTRDNVYALYMTGYDSVVSPTKQFVESIDVIAQLINEHNCDPDKIFHTLGVNKILDLAQKRKLSPWFLIASGAFRVYLASLDEDDYTRLSDGIQVSAMIPRIKKNETLFAELSKATKELGL